MGKKGKAKTEGMVTVAELAEEFEMKPQKLRALIREAGFNAPATGVKGFGPKAKYEWEANSPELAKIRKAIEAVTNE